MYDFRRTRRALLAIATCVAFLFAAGTAAWAEGADDGAQEKSAATVVVTKDGTKTVRLVTSADGEYVLESQPEPERADGAATRMHVVVRRGSDDGDVRVLELQDGKWVAKDEDVHVEHEVTVHRLPSATTTFGTGSHDRDPMSTVLRWLMTDGMAGELPNDPMRAWFEGGADVPMAGLRDALKADGWTAQSLQAWFVQHLLGGLAALHAPPAPSPHGMHGPMRGHWFEVGRGAHRCRDCGSDCGARGRGHDRCHSRQRGCDGGCGCSKARSSCRGDCGSCRGHCGSCNQRGSCGSCKGSCGSCKGHCGSCDKRGSCGSCRGHCGSCDKRGSCGSCRGHCGSCDERGSCGKGGGSSGDCGSDCGPQRRGPARRQAWMLWNDGSGWRHRRVDSQGPVAHGGHEHGNGVRHEDMTFHGGDTDDTPELARLVRELIGETHSGRGDSAKILIEGLDLLPPELLGQVPPGVLEGVLKELEGLGLGELLAPSKRGCDDCPNKGKCQGGDCDKSEGAESGSCCGTCKGDCKDCPKAQDGSCAGNCKDCPNRKTAEKKACCGTCKGEGAK